MPAEPPSSTAQRFRLAELMAALSLATDLGMGQPPEQALRTCLVALRIGELAGLDQRALSEVYYVALLRFLGCSANAREMAELAGGDEIAFRVAMARVLGEARPEIMRSLVSSLAPEQPASRRAGLAAGFVATGAARMREGVAAHCELAENLASRIGLDAGVRHALEQAFERWDGSGFPKGSQGEAIALSARIVFMARDAEVLGTLLGARQAAAAIARRRRMGAYDPALVDLFLPAAEGILAESGAQPAWEAALEAEPEPRPWVPAARLDQVLEAFADFVDLKSPFTAGHSRGVAELASRTAGAETARQELLRAGLVHDLGRMCVSNAIWEKPGQLSEADWERVRLHAYYTERILVRSPALAPLAPLASAHHERLDGSGYHRGLDAAAISRPARLLAAADAYQAMTQPRPHRPALGRGQLADELRNEVARGRLDRDAVRAVLESAGQSERIVAEWPNDLTDREVEVLRLLCRGALKKQVAAALRISPSTVDHHVRHIYEKLGVSSRAGATVFALQDGLLA